jgi:tRNA(adenine34) deaminase
MNAALEQARIAAARGEVPVGCVLVNEQQVQIASGYNLRETLNDPTAHAEMLALRWAAMDLRTWRLSGITAYVTLEPCPMCAGALINARVSRVVYGCDDPKAGAVKTLYTLGSEPRLNHRFEWTSGVLAEPCAQLLREFFQVLRERARVGRPRGRS